MALRLLVVLLAISWVAEWTILVATAESVCWKAVVLEIMATGLLGVAVIRHATAHFRRKLMSTARAGEPLGNVLIDGAILLLAGGLLLLPGIISDVAGLLLLVPPVRWLIVAGWRRSCLPRRRDDDQRDRIRG